MRYPVNKLVKWPNSLQVFIAEWLEHLPKLRRMYYRFDSFQDLSINFILVVPFAKQPSLHQFHQCYSTVSWKKNWINSALQLWLFQQSKLINLRDKWFLFTVWIHASLHMSHKKNHYIMILLFTNSLIVQLSGLQKVLQYCHTVPATIPQRQVSMFVLLVVEHLDQAW